MLDRIFDVKGDAHRPNPDHKAYCKWLHMHLRAGKASGYLECSIHPDWYVYSTFKAWLTSHEGWRELEIDKDLMVPGNKVYGPDTCCLIPQSLNAFLVDNLTSTGKLSGAFFQKRLKNKPYQAKVAVTNETGVWGQKHLGYFATELEAHNAWKEAKHKQACRLAEGIQDQRIANALRTRYL